MFSEAHILLQSIPNFMEIPGMQQLTENFFFEFEIIAFESVALVTWIY